MPTRRPDRRGDAPTDRSRPKPEPADRRRPRPEQTRGDLLYGRNAIREALRGRRAVHRLIISEGVVLDERVREIIALATARDVRQVRRPRSEIDEMAGQVNHQGLLAEAGPFPYADTEDIAARPGVVVALDHLQDPQNVGTLIRAAVAFSAAGILIPTDRAAEITPGVVNASAGAAEHLPIGRVTNLGRELERLKTVGRWVIGLDTGDDAVGISTTDLPQPAVLVIGAESSGLGRLIRERCDLMVAIPMSDTIESLNAATAGSIALFELDRQRTVGA